MGDFQDKFSCPACADLNPYLLPSICSKGFYSGKCKEQFWNQQVHHIQSGLFGDRESKKDYVNTVATQNFPPPHQSKQ